MDKREELKESLKEAMRNKDQQGVSTIRLILSALKDRDINARGQGNADGIGEPEIFSMMQGMIKQRKESAQIYKDAGRDDLLNKELAEIGVIERFMPKQMDDAQVLAEIEKIIAETGAAGVRDMGKVMNVLKTKFAGQIDMGKAGGLVKQKLG